MKEITVYTDGACSGNPGPGGWAAILVYGEKEKELSGGERETTNQRMEIQAAIEALRALREPCAVTLYSDSAYVINCFRDGWYRSWRKNGWKNSKGDAVANRELWEQLISLAETHQMSWQKVKGHAGHVWNERCDELARQAARAASAGPRRMHE